MPTVTCECGKKLQIREDRLGQDHPCPDCKQMLNLDFWNCLECNSRNSVETIFCYICQSPKPKPLDEIVPSETPITHRSEEIAVIDVSHPAAVWNDPVQEHGILYFGSVAANVFGFLSVMGILFGGFAVLVTYLTYKDDSFFTVTQAVLFLASSISTLLFSTITIAVLHTLRTLSKIENKLAP